MEKLYDSETGCCPRFDPVPWTDKEIKFKDKLFLKESITCIFYIPIGFDKIMVKNAEAIAKAKAVPKEPLMLYDCKGLFGADLYIHTAKEVPEKEMEKITGIFLTKVFEGDFKDSGKWAKEMKEYVKKQGKEMKKMYYFYTTCPSCAKYYGKNYTVILGQIE